MNGFSRRALILLAAFASAGLTLATPVVAQVTERREPAHAAPAEAFEPCWELETFGGIGSMSAGRFRSQTVSNAQVFLPAPGGGNVLQVSSWLLPQAVVMGSIQSLGVVASGPTLSLSTLGRFGVRLSRWERRNIGIEVSASISPGRPAVLGPLALSAIEQSRTSFVTGFSDLFAASPNLYSGSSVAAATSSSTTAGAQFETVAGLIFTKASGRLRPYGSVGMGERGRIGGVDSVGVTGRYTFLTPSGAEVDETDSATLHYHGGWTTVAAFGAGARLLVGRHSGIRVDASVTTGPDRDGVTVDEQPFSRLGTRSGFVFQPATGTVGSIVFSNTPSQPTSLSGPAVLNQTTAAGRGWRSVWTVAVGWFWRL